MIIFCECGYATFDQPDLGERMIAGYIHTPKKCIPMDEEIARLRSALRRLVDSSRTVWGYTVETVDESALADARAVLDGKP